jgi:N6-adenosine-specific RNA methylase IME4
MEFPTAIIDPPWAYRTVTGNGNKNTLSGFVQNGDDVKYNTMNQAALMALPVGKVVSRYLFMWTAKGFFAEGLELLRKWDFEYKSALFWHKTTGMGVGFWFRSDTEVVLVGAKRGAPSIRTNERDNIIELIETEGDTFGHPRTRHSEKPSLLHEFIEKRRKPNKEKNTPTYFPGPYLEIFGRGKRRPNWYIIGNEAEATMGEDITVSLQNIVDGKAKQ